MAKAIGYAALAIGAVALIATGVGAVALGGLAGSLTVAGVSTSTLLLVSGGLSVAATLLQKTPKVTASQTDRLTASVDPRAFRKTWLGQTAGPVDVRYEEWSGKDQEICDWIISMASHAIDGVDEIWFDTEMAWSATTGVVGKYVGYFSIPNLILEGTPQNAFTFASGKWNAGTSRMTGCAYARFRFKVTGNSKKAESPFSSGIPSRITIIGRGAKLYDPRRDSTVPGGSGPMRWNDQSTWRYTADDGVVIGENLPLQILRVVLGWRIRNPSTGVMKLATGSGVPGRRISFPSFQIAANLADELVNRKAGGNEPRYHGAGVISEGDDQKTVLDMLCAACCSRFRDTGGKLALVVSHNDLASAAIDDGLNDDDVVGAFNWDPDPSLEATPNVVRGKYVDPTTASLYQLIDYPEVSLPSTDGQDRFLSLDLGVVESPSHAQRVAKQVLQRRQYARQFTAPFDIRAWKYNVGDVLPFTFAPLGFTRALFRVKEQELGQGGTCNMLLTFETPDFYLWDASDVAPVQAADPIVYDSRNNPLILAIDDAAKTALEYVAPGAVIGGDRDPVTGVVIGGKPAREVIADLADVRGELDGALVDVGNANEAVRLLDEAVATFQGKIDGALAQFGSFDLVLPSVLKLAQLVQTTNAIVRARTTLDNQPIGTVVDDVRTKTDTVVEDVSLMGARSFDRSSFMINLKTVMVDGKTSLGQRLEQIEAKGANDLNAVVSDLVTVIVDGETATARRLTNVEASAKGLSGTVSGLSQVIADGDKVQSDRLDVVEANLGDPVSGNGLFAKVQELSTATVGADGTSLASKIGVLQSQLNTPDTGVYARIGTIENTVVKGPNSHAERLTTVEASVSAPGTGLTAKVQELTSATIGADGSSLASKVGVLQSQLNTPDTGVYARIGTIEQTVVKGPNSHASRLDTIEASVSGPGGNSLTAKVQDLSTATIGGPGTDSLAQKLTTVQSQLNTPDTGLFARVGTLNNALFQGGNAIATRLDSVEASVGKDPESGLRAQVSFLTTATVTPTGSAIAKAVLSLDALGRVVGTTATNNGVQGLFDIVFDRTRIIRPDGTLLFRAGGSGNGEDPSAVYMPNVIIDRLRLGAVGTAEIGIGAIRQVFAVELTSNPALPATNGQQITYLTLYVNKQRADSSLRISYNMRPRPGRDYAATFILGRQPLDGSVKTTMDQQQFWAASCLINNLRSVRIPMNLSRTFDGLPAGEYLITVDIIAIGGGNDQGFMEAGSNLYVEEVKR